MKTFEERYTAWIDRELSGPELAAFERELPPEAVRDREEAQKLGGLLRGHCTAPAIGNPEFFNQRILEQIEAEAPVPAVERRRFRWTLPRMAWAGACCLAISFTMYQTMVKNSLQPPPTETEYLAKILDSRTDDPDISATAFHSKDNNVTVLWLDGLGYLPEDYGL
jgi:hypothetical protein